MRSKVNKSIYDQGDTLIELQSKLQLTESVLSLRPVLIKHSDKEESLLTASQLSKPFLNEEIMQDIMQDLEEVKDDLFPQILHSIKAVKKQIKLQLLAYLQEGGVRYKNTRRGEKNGGGTWRPETTLPGENSPRDNLPQDNLPPAR